MYEEVITSCVMLGCKNIAEYKYYNSYNKVELPLYCEKHKKNCMVKTLPVIECYKFGKPLKYLLCCSINNCIAKSEYTYCYFKKPLFCYNHKKKDMIKVGPQEIIDTNSSECCVIV